MGNDSKYFFHFIASMDFLKWLLRLTPNWCPKFREGVGSEEKGGVGERGSHLNFLGLNKL